MTHSREIRAYCAGLVDGEGCIRINKRKKGTRFYYQIRATIYNTNREALDFVSRFYGGAIHIYERRRKKPFYILIISSRQAYAFLQEIQEFAIIKREQVKNAIDFYEYQLSVGRPSGMLKGHPGVYAMLNEEQLGMYESYFVMSGALNQKRMPVIKIGRTATS